eukprot:tig00000076_g2348.t1
MEVTHTAHVESAESAEETQARVLAGLQRLVHQGMPIEDVSRWVISSLELLEHDTMEPPQMPDRNPSPGPSQRRGKPRAKLQCDAASSSLNASILRSLPQTSLRPPPAALSQPAAQHISQLASTLPRLWGLCHPPLLPFRQLGMPRPSHPPLLLFQPPAPPLAFHRRSAFFRQRGMPCPSHPRALPSQLQPAMARPESLAHLLAPPHRPAGLHRPHLLQACLCG